MLRLVVITGLVVAAGLGCDDSEDPVVDGAASPATVVEGTTTSVATTTTTPVSFEDEVKQAAIDLLAIRNEVFQSPDVSRVPEYIAETCVCLERERGIVEELASRGLRWVDVPVEPRAVQVTIADEAEPTVTLVARQPGTSIVGVDGSVVEEVSASDTAAYRMTLIRTDGRWLLNSLEGVELNDDVVADVVAEGLP